MSDAPGDRTVRRLLRLWGTGLTSPGEAMAALPDEGVPVTGLAAVLTRFVVTDLVETVPLALLGRRPFTPTRLSVAPERHYRVQALLLPAFGLAEWLLMGAAARAVVGRSGRPVAAARVLDVVGAGMLVPMPLLWAADVAMLVTGRYRLPGLAVTHAAVQLWETALFAIGLHAAHDVPWRPAVIAGAAASGVYVLGGSRLVR